MKLYVGTRLASGGCSVTVREQSSQERPLDPRTDLRNHSPTGFEWGYAGSGPAQLALALLADALQDDERAELLYQKFKRRVVTRLPKDRWKLAEDDVLRAVEGLEG